MALVCAAAAVLAAASAIVNSKSFDSSTICATEQSVVVDAPVQMERELAQLRQAAGSVSARDLEPMLAAAGAALPDGRLPSSIEYTPGELRLRGVTLAPDEESVVSGRLQAAGYRARMDDGSLLLRTEVSP